MMKKIKPEFLVYLRFNDNLYNLGLEVLNDVYIPKQAVSYGSVDVTGESEDGGYDAVLHKHPRGIKNFSYVDEESINSNHDISILVISGMPALSDWQVVRRFETACGKILTKRVNIKLYLPDVDVDLSNIKVKETEIEWVQGRDGVWRIKEGL